MHGRMQALLRGSCTIASSPPCRHAGKLQPAAAALTEMGVAVPVATSHTKKPGEPGLAPASRWPCKQAGVQCPGQAVKKQCGQVAAWSGQQALPVNSILLCILSSVHAAHSMGSTGAPRPSPPEGASSAWSQHRRLAP